ncbi:MAG: type II toxin-antitoxin system RelE/ParE family toxin [Candidatus Algichlamydia australiensis]|nr:type II toxin-antitoxin system RelE/ParE family toxin [Chlamydiales bacterium]
MKKRTIAFVGSTKKDLEKLPIDVKEIFVYAIDMAAKGKMHSNGKVLKGFKGASVVEIKADYNSDTFRAVYTIKHKEFLYVLQVFKKKSSKGISLSKKDKELLEIRIKSAKRHYSNYG